MGSVGSVRAEKDVGFTSVYILTRCLLIQLKEGLDLDTFSNCGSTKHQAVICEQKM